MQTLAIARPDRMADFNTLHYNFTFMLASIIILVGRENNKLDPVAVVVAAGAAAAAAGV